jgi:hypothetical protein
MKKQTAGRDVLGIFAPKIITHAAFYAGWPNAWAVFAVAMEVYSEDNANQ